MTASQSKEVPAAPTLFDIASNLEHIHVALHRVENMLSLYDERIESDIEFLSESKDGYAKYIASRYDQLRSVMEVMQANFKDSMDSMRIQIDTLYESHRKEISAQDAH